MKILVPAAAAAALALGAPGAEAGPSAKFAAGWKTDFVTLYKISPLSTFGTIGSAFDGIPDTAIGVASEKLATIKVPQGKELLIGASGVATLATFTQAKGKGGNDNNAVDSTAIAAGGLYLTVKVAPEGSNGVCTNGAVDPAAPGNVTFASRKQELSVTVNLTDGQGTVITDSDFLVDVTVALGIETTAAHHFNFVAADLDSGEYDVWACWTATADVIEEGEAIAGAAVAIGKRMVTVQEVRGVKDQVIDLTGNN